MKKKWPIRYPLSAENLLFLLVLTAFLFLYGIYFSRFQAAAPSPCISRELELDRLDYGFSKINNTHIQVLPDPAERGAWVLGIDGERTRMILVDIKGTILSSFILDLDLSQASSLEAHMTEQGRISLYYKHRSLYKTDIDLAGRILSEQILIDKVADFSTAGNQIIYCNSEGLWGLSLAKGNSFSDPVHLNYGRSESFRLCRDGETQYLLYSEMRNDSSAPLVCLSSTDHFRSSESISLYPEGERKYYGEIVDSYARDQTLYVLCLYRDGRFEMNTISLLRINCENGEILQDVKLSLPYLKSRYKITEVKGGKVFIVHQLNDRRSINLGITAVSQDGTIHTDPYTKTRSMSKYGGIFTTGEYTGFIFSDIDFDKRTLLFASGDPDLIHSTTSLRSLGFWYPFGTTLLLYMVSLFVGGLQLLVVLPLPVAATLLMDRLGSKIHPFYPIAGIFLLQAGLKQLISFNLIHVYGLFRFSPPVVGKEPVIYIVIFLSTCFSLWLTLRVYKKRSLEHISFLDFYIRFAVYDYLQYVALVLIYIANTILSGKI